MLGETPTARARGVHIPAASRFNHPRGEVNKSSVVPTHGTFVPRPRGFGALWEWVAVSRVLLESRLPRVASLDIHGARVRGRRDALRRGLVLSELLWQTRSMNPRSSTDSQDSALVLGVLREILSGTVTPEPSRLLARGSARASTPHAVSTPFRGRGLAATSWRGTDCWAVLEIHSFSL